MESRTEYPLYSSAFEKGLVLVTLDGPGKINSLVRGRPYVRAMLHDPRIRRTDW